MGESHWEPENQERLRVNINRGEINIIAGGGPTNLAIKRHLGSVHFGSLLSPRIQPNILFTNENQSFSDPTKDDPVANWKVKRILID